MMSTKEKLMKKDVRVVKTFHKAAIFVSWISQSHNADATCGLMHFYLLQ